MVISLAISGICWFKNFCNVSLNNACCEATVMATARGDPCHNCAIKRGRSMSNNCFINANAVKCTLSKVSGLVLLFCIVGVGTFISIGRKRVHAASFMSGSHKYRQTAYHSSSMRAWASSPSFSSMSDSSQGMISNSLDRSSASSASAGRGDCL